MDNYHARMLSKALTGFGFTALQLLFVTLKLTHTIDWSWWLVMLPTLIPVGVVAVGVLIVLVIGILSLIYI